jgi:hypothetical protein
MFDFHQDRDPDANRDHGERDSDNGDNQHHG